MDRRTLLGAVAGGAIAVTAGSTGSAQGPSTKPQTSFELVDRDAPVGDTPGTGDPSGADDPTAIGADDPPEVDVDEDTVTVRGTVKYASSSCGTVRLTHEGYEPSQNQLNLLVVAADDVPDDSSDVACTDDIGADGYRVEIDREEHLRYVAVTEHHVFGETYTTVVDLPSGSSGTGEVDDGPAT